jgi:hypothetical protein
LHAIRLPGLHLLRQIGHITIQAAGVSRRTGAFGKGVRGEKALNGMPTHLQLPRNRSNAGAVVLQGSHLFIPSLTSGAALLATLFEAGEGGMDRIRV